MAVRIVDSDFPCKAVVSYIYAFSSDCDYMNEITYPETATIYFGIKCCSLNGRSAQLGYTVLFTLDVLENAGQKTN